MTDRDRFVIVWQGAGAADDFGAFGTLVDPNDPNGARPDFPVSGTAAYLQRDAAVAAKGGGNFVVAWQASGGLDGSGSGVFGQFFTGDGSKVGAELQINEFTLGTQGLPALAANTNGDVVAVWESVGQDGSGVGIFGRRFGPRRGSLGIRGPTPLVVYEDAGAATLYVDRSAENDGAVSVDYATSDGTAQAGSDYTSASGTLSWAAGDSTPRSFVVPIDNDSNESEVLETLHVALSNATGGAVVADPSVATLEIRDEVYSFFSLAAADFSAPEDAGQVQIGVRRQGPPTGAIAVAYRVESTGLPDSATGGSACGQGVDFLAATGIVTWAANDFAPKTIGVSLCDDLQPEGPESLRIVLAKQSPGDPVALADPSMAILTLQDGAAGTLGFDTGFPSVQAVRGEVFSLSVLRQSGAEGAASVRLQFLRDGQPVSLPPVNPDPLAWVAGQTGAVEVSVNSSGLAGIYEIDLVDPTGAALDPLRARTVLVVGDAEQLPGLPALCQLRLFEPGWLNLLVLPLFWWWNRRWLTP